VLEAAPAAQAAPDPAAATVQLAATNAGAHGEAGRADYSGRTARGQHWRWMRFEPTHIVTWDNTKLRR
jgi:hypothetical protein